MLTIIILLLILLLEYKFKPRLEITRTKQVLLFYNSNYTRKYKILIN